jgi:hypothetical protein
LPDGVLALAVYRLRAITHLSPARGIGAHLNLPTGVARPIGLAVTGRNGIHVAGRETDQVRVSGEEQELR